MAQLVFPLEPGKYITNTGHSISLEKAEHVQDCLYSRELKFVFNCADGKAKGTIHRVVACVPEDVNLTLPPVVGKKYFYRRRRDETLHECTITGEGTFKNDKTYLSSDEEGLDFTFWADGEAKIRAGRDDEDYVAYLVEDAPVSDLEDLRQKWKAMRKRLEEIGAC